MSRWPLLILVLLASALGLVACGGDESEDADPTALLKETFGAGKEVKSGRLDLSVRVNAKGVQQLPEPVTVALRGPFESQGPGKLPHFDFEAEINTGGQAFTAGAVSTGGKGFLKFQSTSYVVPDDLYKQFKDSYAKTAECNEKQGADKGNATFQALGIDPRRWLQEAKNEGKESVGGAEAIHISSRIDVPKFLEDVNRVLGRTDLEAVPCAEDAANKEAEPKPGSRKLTAQQRKNIAEAIKNARVDIWTGAEDKILRRLNVDLRIVGKGNKQSGDVRLDLAIGGLNKKQAIKAPSGAKPLDDLLEQFGGAAPGLGSGSQNQTPAPGGQSGSGSSYEQCVAEASGDVQKLQECLDTANQ